MVSSFFVHGLVGVIPRCVVCVGKAAELFQWQVSCSSGSLFLRFTDRILLAFYATLDLSTTGSQLYTPAYFLRRTQARLSTTGNSSARGQKRPTEPIDHTSVQLSLRCRHLGAQVRQCRVSILQYWSYNMWMAGIWQMDPQRYQCFATSATACLTSNPWLRSCRSTNQRGCKRRFIPFSGLQILRSLGLVIIIESGSRSRRGRGNNP